MLLIVHDVAVVLDDVSASDAFSRARQNLLQLHSADHARYRQALVHRGMEGVELDIPTQWQYQDSSIVKASEKLFKTTECMQQP